MKPRYHRIKPTTIKDKNGEWSRGHTIVAVYGPDNEQELQVFTNRPEAIARLKELNAGLKN